MKKRIKMEIYKDIPNYEGVYQVSNLGNVKSLDRVDSTGRGVKGIVLKGSPNSRGYPTVYLSIDNIQTGFNIHQLVAMAFLNHKPTSRSVVVDHINNIKTDNRLENLQVISNRENCSKETRGKSKYTGVYWLKKNKKWQSQIQINGKRKYLGSFDNEYDAHLKYQEVLKTI